MANRASRSIGGKTASAGALLPAAARRHTALSREEAVTNAFGVDRFLAEVGGREQLTEVLELAASSLEGDRIVGFLLDPRYDGWSLRKICHLAGITVADLLGTYRKAMLARAHIQASHIIATRLPPIVEDVMTRAAPQTIDCPACGGTGHKANGADCRPCRATGSVRSEPDLDRQKLALELGHLTTKGGGFVVQQTTTVAAQAVSQVGPGALEQLQQAVGEMLFGSARHAAQAAPAAEADVVDVAVDVAAIEEPPREQPAYGDPGGEIVDPLDPDVINPPEDEDEDEPPADPDAPAADPPPSDPG